MAKVIRGWRRVVAVGVSGVLCACGTINPYEHIPYALPKKPAADAENKVQLAGNASEALDLAERYRQRYYDNLSGSARLRNFTGLGLIGLSGWAVYNAMKGTGPNSTLTEGDSRRGTRLGVVAASLYAAREFMVNPSQEAAYAEGYRALTCLMLQSGPLLMTEYASRTSLPPVSYDAYGLSPLFPAAQADTDLDRFRFALDQLERRIAYLNEEVAKVEQNATVLPELSRDLANTKSGLGAQIVGTRKALLYARNALSDGRVLQRTVERSGMDIQGRVGIVVAAINEQVQAKQLELGKVTDLIKNAQDITSSIINIGGSTAADQVEVTTADESTAMNGVPPGGVLYAAAGSLALAYIAAQVSAAVPASTPAVSQAPSPTSATGDPKGVAVAPDVSASKPKVPVKPAKAAPPKKAAASAPVGAPVTTDQLKQERDHIDELIKQATNAEKVRNDAKLAEAKAKEQEKKEEKQRLDRDKERKDSPSCNMDSTKDKGGCSTYLAQQTERLYAARRPVVHELLAFRTLTRAAAATPECVELAPLRVSPSDVVRARPGDSVFFLLTQRASGSPLAVMQGSPDPKTGATFTLQAQQGTTSYVAKVDIGAQMPKQTLRLVVSDSKLLVSQNLLIVVGEPRRPPVDLGAAVLAATAAASAAASASVNAAAAAKAVAAAASAANGK